MRERRERVVREKMIRKWRESRERSIIRKYLDNVERENREKVMRVAKKLRKYSKKEKVARK